MIQKEPIREKPSSDGLFRSVGRAVSAGGVREEGTPEEGAVLE
jgi:hypothetical protein